MSGDPQSRAPAGLSLGKVQSLLFVFVPSVVCPQCKQFLAHAVCLELKLAFGEQGQA